MLVSGGKVIAIDSIKKGNTNKDTLSGDGVWTNLGVNTDVIATTKKLEDTKSELVRKIDSASAELSSEIKKKQDELKFELNEFDKITAIGPKNGSTTALAGGSNIVVSAGDNTRVDSAISGEQTIYTINVTANPTNVTVSGENGLTARRDNSTSSYYLGLSSDYIKAITSVSSKLPTSTFEAYSAAHKNDDNQYYSAGNYIEISSHKIIGYDWTNTIKSASSKAYNDSTANAKSLYYPLSNPSGFISGDLTQYYKKVETSSKEQLDTEFKKYLPNAQYAVDSATFMNLNELEFNDRGEISSYNGSAFGNILKPGSGIIIDGDIISTSGLVNTSSFTSSVNVINNYITVISGDVSAISSVLDTKLYISSFKELSGDFYTNDNPSGFINSSYVANELKKYYKKTETSGAEELDNRFEPIEYDVELLKANSAHYTVVGDNNRISVDADTTNKIYTVNFNSAGLATENWVSANFLSANALEGLSGRWAFSADVDKRLEDTSAWANETFQPKGDYLSANALVDVSGKWNQVSAKLDTSATTNWDVTEYSGVNPIKVENHEISIDLDDYFTKDETIEEIETRLANYGGYVTAASGTSGEPLVDNPSTKYIYLVKMESGPLSSDNYKEWIYTSAENIEQWECIGETTMDLTPYLTKEEAEETYQPKGNYVTSGDYITAGPAWVLVNDNDGVHWSGLDVSELGKKYIVTSTNHTVYVGSAQDGNTITYNLSANIPTIPGISGYNGLSGYYNSANNKYFIGVDERGLTYYRGIAASLSNDNKALFTNPIQSENITYNNGVFTIPSNVAKVTFSINEKIENNVLTTNNVANHDFNLNKIALYCNNSEIISTQEYYHNELGVSELSLTYTIDNSNLGSNDYSIRYDGATLTGNFECNISIIEEVLSFGTGGGTASATYHEKTNNLVHVDNTNFEIYADDLSGISPIYIQDNKNIGLSYDELQFDLSGGKLQINIQTSGGNIDQEAFEKLANIVNGRITETIPIGLVNSYESLGDGGAFSYLFRPTMEFDVSHNTKARIMTHNASVNSSKAQVAISELNENNAYVTIMWWSEIKTLTAQAGTVTLTANPGCTETRTLYPDRLYYATVINRDQQTQYVGFENKFLDDAGAYDIAYWAEHSTNGFARNLPGSLNGIPASNLGQTGQAKLKPYIAFRNED